MGYILSICVMTSSVIAMWLYDEPTLGIWLAAISVWLLVVAGVQEILKILTVISDTLIALLKK